MGFCKPILLIYLTAVAVNSVYAAPPSLEDVIGTSCSVAVDVFSQCHSALGEEKHAATCCTPYSVLKSFNCFCDPDFSFQAQAMMSADVRQALLQCPGEGHVSSPVQCNEDNQQVGVWLHGDDEEDSLSSLDAKFLIMREINDQLSAAQLDQLTSQQDDLTIDYGDDASITMDLTVDVGSAGVDSVVRRGVTIGASDFGSSIADLSAKVDFEIGPDVSSDEIRQILQGVTEWVATMVDDNADPFGDLASLEQSGELTSITAHVAEVISQMAGTLNSLGANEDMDVEITYEFDLAAPEFNNMAVKGSAQDLAPLRDSMISASSDYATVDLAEPLSSGSHHMGHHGHHMGHHGHHMGHGHKCLIRQTYRWLCHHKEFIRMALVIELVLCLLFGIVHMVWSCCLKAQILEECSSESELKTPLIESAAAYAPADERVIISPLWSHVIDSKSGISLV